MKISMHACLLMLITLSSCAQGKYGIVKTHAYYQESVPGMIAVDDDGRQIRQADTVYTVFLETKETKKPVWKHAWVNGESFTVLSTIMATPYIAGMKNDTDEQVTLSAGEGNQLVQLNLETTEKIPVPGKYANKIPPNNILLQGMLNDKKIYLVVKQMQHLRGKEYQ